MNDFEVIISLASSALALLIGTITFLTKYIKSSKGKKIANQTIVICNALLSFIEEAEKLKNFTGAEKKEYVMVKANQFAIDNKIKFDKEMVSKRIEDLIILTKEVNNKKGIIISSSKGNK